MILNKLRVADHGPPSDIVRNRKFESISLQRRVACEKASERRRVRGLARGGAASGDIGYAMRTDTFGMHFTGGHRATVADVECFGLAGAGEGDLAAEHHDARVPVMRMVDVHLTRSKAAIEDLVALTPQVSFEIALVHHKIPSLVRH
jgi:hypothetical protein